MTCLDDDPSGNALETITRQVVACGRCPRLVTWREEAAHHAPTRFAGEPYWARPVPGFGDPSARIYVLGLAPSAHGGNRTGRSFTGNPTADWLVAALYRAGLASQPSSEHRHDGLRLTDVWMASAVRCAPPQNRPSAEERARCLPYLSRELAALTRLRVVVALGQFAWRCALEVTGAASTPFGHGARQSAAPGLTILASYHPSRQNTNTGRLTAAMLDDVVAHARQLATG